MSTATAARNDQQFEWLANHSSGGRDRNIGPHRDFPIKRPFRFGCRADRGGSLTVQSGTYSGILSGTGDLDKTGASTLTLSNASNIFSGNTFVNAGTIVAASLGTGDVQVTTNLTLTSNTALASYSTVTLASGTTSALELDFDGIQAIGTLVVNGVSYAPGTYTVAQLNSYLGNTFTAFSNGSGFTGQIQVTGQASPFLATVTLSNLSATYDGTPKAITVTTTPPSLNVTVTYNGSSTIPTNPGSYAVVATVVDASYHGSANGTLVIGKGTAGVTLGNLSAAYDGTAHAATATTVPSGLNVTFTYNGSATAPTAQGSYAVVATVNDADYTGGASGTLVIGKPLATVTLGNLNFSYTGKAHPATATTVRRVWPLLSPITKARRRRLPWAATPWWRR